MWFTQNKLKMTLNINIKCELNLTPIIGEEEKPKSITCIFFLSYHFQHFSSKKKQDSFGNKRNSTDANHNQPWKMTFQYIQDCAPS